MDNASVYLCFAPTYPHVVVRLNLTLLLRSGAQGWITKKNEGGKPPSFFLKPEILTHPRCALAQDDAGGRFALQPQGDAGGRSA